MSKQESHAENQELRVIILDHTSESQGSLQHSRRIAFSLVELIVVIAIIAILLGLILPAVMRVRSAAARTVCSDRLRQIGLGFQNYHAANGVLPPGMSRDFQPEPFLYMSWRPRLLPYLEHETIWRDSAAAYRSQNIYPPPSPPHHLSTILPVFGCPVDPRVSQTAVVSNVSVAFSSYLGASGSRQTRHDGMLFVDSAVRLSHATDGTSQTLLMGERPHSANNQFGWWYAGVGQSQDGSAAAVLSTAERSVSIWGDGCPIGPYSFGPGKVDNQCDAFHFWSLHPGGAHFAFADGSVHFLSYSAADILPALSTRAGGEAVTFPD